MRIPLAAVEPDDLLRIQVDADFSMEFRVPPFGRTHVVQNGKRYLIAWQTPASIGAVTSADGEVELLQRRNPLSPEADREPALHPHGWAITRPGKFDMHYFEDTESLCGKIIGYGGLCYPHFDQSYFPEQKTLCKECQTVLERRPV